MTTIKKPTASAFLFCRTGGLRRPGLTWHPRLTERMLPGGHVAPEESTAACAQREFGEDARLLKDL